MKYIVTGGAGFIGSNLVDRLLKDGHEIVIVDNLENEESRLRVESRQLSNWADDNPLMLNEDIATMMEFSPFRNAHGMFHLAALPRVQLSIEKPIKSHSVNVNGTLNMLKACKEMDIKRFIFSSSSAVYGDCESFPTSEKARLDPTSPYGLHKVMGEQYCALFEKIYNLETFSLRYFNVFGERQPLSGPYSLVMGIFANQLLNELPLTINGDGEQRRDFVYVDDVIKVNIWMMDNKNISGIYNVGTGESFSFNDIANTIIKRREKGKIKYIPFPKELEKNYQSFTQADLKKLRSTGYTNEFMSVNKGINLYLDRLLN